MHQIADAVDVEDDGVLAVAIDDAFELADHGRRTNNPSFRGRANGSGPKWPAR
jgi:hypothetical protein